MGLRLLKQVGGAAFRNFATVGLVVHLSVRGVVPGSADDNLELVLQPHEIGSIILQKATAVASTCV